MNSRLFTIKDPLIVLASIAFVMTKTLLVRVHTLIPYAAKREVIKLA